MKSSNRLYQNYAKLTRRQTPKSGDGSRGAGIGRIIEQSYLFQEKTAGPSQKDSPAVS